MAFARDIGRSCPVMDAGRSPSTGQPKEVYGAPANPRTGRFSPAFIMRGPDGRGTRCGTTTWCWLPGSSWPAGHPACKYGFSVDQLDDCDRTRRHLKPCKQPPSAARDTVVVAAVGSTAFPRHIRRPQNDAIAAGDGPRSASLIQNALREAGWSSLAWCLARTIAFSLECAVSGFARRHPPDHVELSMDCPSLRVRSSRPPRWSTANLRVPRCRRYSQPATPLTQ